MGKPMTKLHESGRHFNYCPWALQANMVSRSRFRLLTLEIRGCIVVRQIDDLPSKLAQTVILDT